MDPTQATQAVQTAHGLDMTQVVTIMLVLATNLGTVIALFVHSDKKAEEHRKEMTTIIEENRKEANDILKGIREDIKDFHGRLCAIEERNKK